MSNKNLANCTDYGLFPFLITCMFNDKLSFIAEFHIIGHFINKSLITADLDAFGTTGKVCRESPQNLNFSAKKVIIVIYIL